MLKAVYLELPWGAQVGKPTQVRASLFGDHLMDFGQVHYVWKFGDKVMDLLFFSFFFLHVFGSSFVLPLSTIIRQWKHQVYIFSTRRILISPGFPPPLTCTTRPGSTPSVWRRSILWAQSPERRPYMSTVMVHTSFSQLISIKITWIQVVRFLCNHYWGSGGAKQKFILLEWD